MVWGAGHWVQDPGGREFEKWCQKKPSRRERQNAALQKASRNGQRATPAPSSTVVEEVPKEGKLFYQFQALQRIVENVTSKRPSQSCQLNPEWQDLEKALLTFVANPIQGVFAQLRSCIQPLQARCESDAFRLQQHVERIQKMAEDGFVVSESDIKMRVDLRDAFIERLRAFVAEVHGLQDTSNAGAVGLAAMDSLLARFSEGSRRLASVIPGFYRLSGMDALDEEEVRKFCRRQLVAVTNWRARHVTAHLSQATDAAIDALCSFLTSKRSLTNIDERLIRKADESLEKEFTFLVADDPGSDAPTREICAAGRRLLKFYTEGESLIKNLISGCKWAEQELSKQQAIASIPYPPSITQLTELLEASYQEEEATDDAEQEVHKLKRRGRDTTAAAKKLEDLTLEKRQDACSIAIAKERARLLCLANDNFPELLVDGEWSESVGVSKGIGSDIVPDGLLESGKRLRDYASAKQMYCSGGKSLYKVTDDAGRMLVLRGFDLRDVSLQRQFFREVKLLGSLRHPHIATITSVFCEGTKVYMQMPWFANGNLRTWLAKTPPTARGVPLMKQFVRDILLGVAHLHSKRLIHSDIKPRSIFLTERMRCVLGEFDGLTSGKENSTARILPLEISEDYTAPEIFEHPESPFTCACDIYSVGMVVSQFFVGVSLAQEQSVICDRFVESLTSPAPESRPSALDAHGDVFLASGESTALAPQHQCYVCFDVYMEQDGILCSQDGGGHFSCDGCVDNYIKSLSTLDAYLLCNQRQLMEDEGKIRCLVPGCTSPAFPPHLVARKISEEGYTSYIAALKKGMEGAVASENAGTIQRLRDQLEDARAQISNDFADHVAREAVKVAERILTLHCPSSSCNVAFVDFDGCFALTCGQCETNFCAWCF